MRIFFPKQIDFFELLDIASRNVIKGASLLVDLLKNMDKLEVISAKVKECEREGDFITHDIINKLNKTFITPIDREDLYALSTKIDDIIDIIWTCAGRFAIYKLYKPTGKSIAMAMDLLAATQVMSKAVSALRNKNYSFVQQYCVEIGNLEHIMDDFYHDALSRLFDETEDPILIIKWKEVYEYLESASDACEDVANILEAIVIKYA